MDQRAAKSELLLHSARQFFRRTVCKRRKPGAVEKLGDAALPFGHLGCQPDRDGEREHQRLQPVTLGHPVDD